MQHEPSAAAGVIVLLCLVAGYLIPTIIAGTRGHQNGLAIFALNLLLGWTFLGWVAAFVWSLTAVTKKPASA